MNRPIFKVKTLFYFSATVFILLLIFLFSTINVQASKQSKKPYLSQTNITLVKGLSTKLKVKNNKRKVHWSTSKKSVATVNSKGKVTAKKKGTATITAKIGKLKLKCKVKVEKPSLSQNYVVLNVNDSFFLNTSIPKQKITWHSSNNAIASISPDGKVTAKSSGETVITAKIGIYILKCKVVVESPTISNGYIVLNLKQSKKIAVRGSSRQIFWNSSRSSVASVSSDGTVTAMAVGTAVITARAGTKTLSCNVLVQADSSKFKSVAHRGYTSTSGSGDNRLTSFSSAKLRGFNYIETDIHFSKDNQPMCCHDAIFIDSDTNTQIKISNYTLEELKSFNYHGETIASLDETLSLCRSLKLGIYLDKVGAITEQQTRLETVFNILRKYDMSTQVTWLVTTEEQARKILSMDSHASISVVMNTRGLSYYVNLANTLKTSLNTVTVNCNCYYTSISEMLECAKYLKNGITYEAYTINSLATYRTFLPYVTGIVSDKICLSDIN